MYTISNDLKLNLYFKCLISLKKELFLGLVNTSHAQD